MVGGEAMRVKLKPGAQAIRFKPPVYLPQEVKWLAGRIERLEAADMVRTVATTL